MAYNSKYTGYEIDDAIGKVGNKLDQTGDASNTSVDFEEATDRLELQKNDKLSVLMGKISKWLKGLKNVAFTASYNDLNDQPTIPDAYTLPTASSGTLGGIKVGNNLTIREDGTLDAEAGGTSIDTSNFATKDKYGDTGINIGRKSGTTVGEGSIAYGKQSTASGTSALAGGYCTANGSYATALGVDSVAGGYGAFAAGQAAKSNGTGQVALGKYNIENSTQVLIVGNGTSSSAKSNAFTIEQDGSAWVEGPIYVGSTSGTNKDDGSKKLATETYVDDAVANAGGANITASTTDLEDGVSALPTGTLYVVYEE